MQYPNHSRDACSQLSPLSAGLDAPSRGLGTSGAFTVLCEARCPSFSGSSRYPGVRPAAVDGSSSSRNPEWNPIARAAGGRSAVVSSSSSSSDTSPNASYSSRVVRGPDAAVPSALIDMFSSPIGAYLLTAAARRRQKNTPTPMPNRETAPSATKNHFWPVASDDKSGNQPRSGGVVTVAGSVDVAEGCTTSFAPDVNAGFEFSPVASPWSPGRCSVGFGCCLLVVGDGGVMMGCDCESIGGRISSMSGTSHFIAFEESIVVPQSIMFHPSNVPFDRGLFWSLTLSVQSPMGFSPLR